MKAELTVIIPAYNEERAILDGKLYAVYAWCRRAQAELIVVDDGSTDDTAGLARQYAQVVTISHAGKAAAIIAGIYAAKGRLILLSDMDQATPIQYASSMLLLLKAQQLDIVIGSRGSKRVGAPIMRKLLSWGQRSLRSALLGMDLTDTQCGFKLITRSAALGVLHYLVIYHPSKLKPSAIPNVSSGFDVEFLYVAQLLGYRIQELSVPWRHQASGRVHLVRDATRGTLDLLRIAWARAQGRYQQRLATGRL